MKSLSYLSHIKNYPVHPMEFFKSWMTAIGEREGSKFLPTMDLATANTKLGVLSRTVVLVGHDHEGFLFVTERNSRKFEDIKLNPNVAATFCWSFPDPQGVESVFQQIRVNGTAVELDESMLQTFYDKESLPAKIRCKICVCGQPVDWNKLKERHDKVLEDFLAGNDALIMNENYVALRIVPSHVDFYHADPNSIADRVLYSKESGSDSWTNQHICA